MARYFIGIERGGEFFGLLPISMATCMHRAHADKEGHRQTDTETGRQLGSQEGRQAGRRTDRQTDSGRVSA